MEQEIWKDIQGYEGLYQVSNLGRVRKILKIEDYKICKLEKQHGYLYCRLNKNNKQKRFRVHRLVAMAFVENKNNNKEINHIDLDKCNNKVSNLEWVTHKENIVHARKNRSWKSRKDGKSILQIKDGKIINEFENIHLASRITKFERTSINKCALGKRKSAYGYQWKYKERD